MMPLSTDWLALAAGCVVVLFRSAEWACEMLLALLDGQRWKAVNEALSAAAAAWFAWQLGRMAITAWRFVP